ncbi:MAG: hypothetical protein COA97_11670 [Flavobacteriales bacterium]|nr:MAG: hypothetical protein COA97_11670 [Flavobacteriales bacterium]
MKKLVINRILLFLLGYVVAFSVNLTYIFPSLFITYSYIFVAYYCLGFFSGNKKLTQFLLISGIIIHFTWVSFFTHFIYPTAAVMITAPLSFYIGIALKKQIWIKSKLSLTFVSLLILLLSTVSSYYGDYYLANLYFFNQSDLVEKQILRKKFPTTTFLTIDNKTIDNTDFKGKVVIIEAWYTSCRYCKQQFPEMEKLASKYSDNKNVKFYYINNGIVDTYEKFIEFIVIKKGKYKIEFLYDNNKSIANFLNQESAPQTFIIDKSGEIQLLLSGYDLYAKKEFIERLEQKINELLSSNNKCNR